MHFAPGSAGSHLASGFPHGSSGDDTERSERLKRRNTRNGGTEE